MSFAEFLRRNEVPRVAAMEPPEYMPGKGEAWCSVCDSYTDRDGLPGIPASKLYSEVPAFYFCTFCGVWDADYQPREAS